MVLCCERETYYDLLEKGYGKRDYSKLHKVPVVDKNGKTRMVYKRINKDVKTENKPKKEPAFNKEEWNKKVDDFVNSLTIDDFSVYDSKLSWSPVTKEEKYEKELKELKRNINTIKSYTPKASYGSILNAFRNISYNSKLKINKANEFISEIQHPVVKDIINNNFQKGQTVKTYIYPFKDIKEWKIEDINNGAVTLRGITDKEGESIVDMKYRSALNDGSGWKEGKALKVYPKGGPKVTSTGISFLEGVINGRV